MADVADPAGKTGLTRPLELRPWALPGNRRVAVAAVRGLRQGRVGGRRLGRITTADARLHPPTRLTRQSSASSLCSAPGDAPQVAHFQECEIRGKCLSA
jgi:hypothetical protein